MTEKDLEYNEIQPHWVEGMNDQGPNLEPGIGCAPQPAPPTTALRAAKTHKKVQFRL